MDATESLVECAPPLLERLYAQCRREREHRAARLRQSLAHGDATGPPPSLAVLDEFPPPLLARVYARWQRECERRAFRFRPDLAHACWSAPSARIVCFSPLFRFYGCLDCGRAHQCEGQWESCFTVLNEQMGSYTCAFSGRALDTARSLGSYSEEIRFAATARHPDALVGTSIATMIKSGSHALARTGIDTARLQRQDRRQEKRDTDRGTKRTHDDLVAEGSATAHGALSSSTSSGTSSPELSAAHERPARRARLHHDAVAGAIAGAERDYAASTIAPTSTATPAGVEHAHNFGRDDAAATGDELGGAVDGDEPDGPVMGSLDAETSSRFNLALMKQPHNIPPLPIVPPTGVQAVSRAGTRLRRLMATTFVHDPFAHMENVLGDFDKHHREQTSAEAPGSSWSTALFAARDDDAPVAPALAPGPAPRVTAQTYRQSVHQGMKRIHADVLAIVTALGPRDQLTRENTWQRVEEYVQLALRLFRFMIAIDPMHAPIRHRRVGVVLMLHMLPENFFLLDYYMMSTTGEQHKMLVWEADPWLHELQQSGWLAALVGDIKRPDSGQGGTRASAPLRKSVVQGRRTKEGRAPLQGSPLPAPLFHRTDVTAWHNAAQAFFRSAHITAEALRTALFS
jgi:hypothetical protein